MAKGIPALNVAVDNDYVCIDPAEAMWSRGRVALLGDAMHTLPAVGIGLAVEDALVLARALGEAGAPTPDVLGKYTEARRPRIKRVYDMFMDSMEGMMVNGLTAQNTNFLRGKEQLKEASSGSSGGGRRPSRGHPAPPRPPPPRPRPRPRPRCRRRRRPRGIRKQRVLLRDRGAQRDPRPKCKCSR